MTVEFVPPQPTKPPTPPAGRIPATPVQIGDKVVPFIIDNGTAQTVINTADFPGLKPNMADIQPDPKVPPFKKHKGAEMIFKRMEKDGKEAPIDPPCKGPVILGGQNLLGTDQLFTTNTLALLGFGKTPAGRLAPGGSAPSGSMPHPYETGQLYIYGVTANGKGCPPITTPAHPDGKLKAQIDTGSHYTTVGPKTAEKLKACEGVKSKGMAPGVPTNTGPRDCEVLSGVELNIPLDDGTVVKCTLDVIVMEALIIGTDQLHFLNLVVISGPEGAGLWPKGKSPMNPWAAIHVEGRESRIVRQFDMGEVSEVREPITVTYPLTSSPSSISSPSPIISGLGPGGAVQPGLRRPTP